MNAIMKHLLRIIIFLLLSSGAIQTYAQTTIEGSRYPYSSGIYQTSGKRVNGYSHRIIYGVGSSNISPVSSGQVWRAGYRSYSSAGSGMRIGSRYSATTSVIGATTTGRVSRRRADSGVFGNESAGETDNPTEPGGDDIFGGENVGGTGNPTEPGEDDNPFGGENAGDTKNPQEPGLPIGEIPLELLGLLSVIYAGKKRSKK